MADKFAFGEGAMSLDEREEAFLRVFEDVVSQANKDCAERFVFSPSERHKNWRELVYRDRWLILLRPSLGNYSVVMETWDLEKLKAAGKSPDGSNYGGRFEMLVGQYDVRQMSTLIRLGVMCLDC